MWQYIYIYTYIQIYIYIHTYIYIHIQFITSLSQFVLVHSQCCFMFDFCWWNQNLVYSQWCFMFHLYRWNQTFGWLMPLFFYLLNSLVPFEKKMHEHQQFLLMISPCEASQHCKGANSRGLWDEQCRSSGDILTRSVLQLGMDSPMFLQIRSEILGFVVDISNQCLWFINRLMHYWSLLCIYIPL